MSEKGVVRGEKLPVGVKLTLTFGISLSLSLSLSLASLCRLKFGLVEVSCVFFLYRLEVRENRSSAAASFFLALYKSVHCKRRHLHTSTSLQHRRGVRHHH